MGLYGKPVLRRSLALGLFLCGIALGAQAGDPPPASVGRAEHAFGKAVAIAKDAVNIAFYFVVGALGVLSYRQAKKTLFTPMRTETFKRQLALFEEMLLFLEECRGLGIVTIFDMERILYANAALLFNDYSSLFFQGEVAASEEKLKRMLEGFSYSVVHSSQLRRADDLVIPDEPSPQADRDGPAGALAKWQQRQQLELRYTDRHHEATRRLDGFIASPLVPAGLKALLRQYRDQVRAWLLAALEVLTEASRELPSKYTTADSVVRAQVHWIWGKFNDRKPDLDGLTDAIQKYVTEYLHVEAPLT